MRKPRKKSSGGAAALENHQHTELHRVFFSKQERHAEVPNPNIQFPRKLQNPKFQKPQPVPFTWRLEV
jgi:hypothetical protein